MSILIKSLWLISQNYCRPSVALLFAYTHIMSIIVNLFNSVSTMCSKYCQNYLLQLINPHAQAKPITERCTILKADEEARPPGSCQPTLAILFASHSFITLYKGHMSF